MSNPNYVFVLDTNRKPLTPCKPSLARKLLNAGKAKVFKNWLGLIYSKLRIPKSQVLSINKVS